MALQALGVYLPQQTLDLLLYLPLPVDGESEDEGEHQQTAQHPGSDLRHPLPALALLLLVVVL